MLTEMIGGSGRLEISRISSWNVNLNVWRLWEAQNHSESVLGMLTKMSGGSDKLEIIP